jgi:diguanylate cyclase (GGDEF)-like protein
VAQAAKENTTLSVVMMDVDNFKEINDVYGHKAGDMVLVELSRRVQNIVRGNDFACRYGGDEFVIILPNMPQKVAYERAEQIRKNVEELAVDYKSIKLKVSSSMGIAVFPQHGTTADLLMRSADKALYASKLAGRNKVTVFDPQGNMNTIRLRMPPKQT